MKKHFCYAVSVLLLAMCLCTSAFAVSDSTSSELDTSEIALAEKVAEAEQYAYMDLDSASDDMKETILEARSTIIYSESWVADGYTGYIIDDADGTVEEVPSFSELFPDWDMPTVDDTAVEDATNMAESQTASITSIPPNSKTCKVYLKNPSDSKNTSPFCTISHKGSWIETSAKTLIPQTYNVGYSRSGYSLGYAVNLTRTQKFKVSTYSYQMDIAVRASTYSTPGYATLTVQDDVYT